MTHSLENKILEALKAKPSQKADELAKSLGSSRAAINKIFYGPLREKFFQDRTYRWSLTAESPRMASVADESDEQTANTDLARLCRYYLARLCRYYLACLSRTDATSIETSLVEDGDDYVINDRCRAKGTPREAMPWLTVFSHPR